MSSDHGDAAVRAGTVGYDLKVARERLGWTLAAMAEGLRIRPVVLEALEAGGDCHLPPAYTLTFLRTYARALGLDADDMARRFRAERAGELRQTELEFPSPVPERSIPVGAVVLLGCVLAIGAYAGWYRFSASREAPPPVHQVPQRLAELVQPPLVPPAPPPAVPKAPVVTQAPPASSSSSSAASLPPTAAAAATEPTPAAAAADTPALPPPVSPSSAAAAVPAPAPVAAEANPSAASGQITLLATADAWLEVRDSHGHVVLNRVLHAGDSWPVPPLPAGGNAKPYVFTTGNAGGTEVEIDGKVIGPLGKDGAVRRNLVLDAEAILGGSLTAAASAPAAKAPSAAVNRP